MRLKDYFNLVRWKNLLMLLLVMILIKYVLFIHLNATVSLTPLFFSLLVLSVISIAAGGYVINDIYDVPADLINKPDRVLVGKKITADDAQLFYSILNVSGILLGFLLSWYVGKISFSVIFILTSLLLYKYSIYFKKNSLYGNLVISFLIFISIITLPLFDLVPATYTGNREMQKEIFLLVTKIGFFAFMLTFLREICKDMEDAEGDLKIAAQTFPIKYGIQKTKLLLRFFTIFTIILILYFSVSYFHTNQWVSLYLTILVIFPLLYFIHQLNSANVRNDFKKISTLLKLIMLAGILIIFLL